MNSNLRDVFTEVDAGILESGRTYKINSHFINVCNEIPENISVWRFKQYCSLADTTLKTRVRSRTSQVYKHDAMTTYLWLSCDEPNPFIRRILLEMILMSPFQLCQTCPNLSSGRDILSWILKWW